MQQSVHPTAVTTFALALLSAVVYSAVLGNEDAISPLRMGIMINVVHRTTFYHYISMVWVVIIGSPNSEHDVP